MNSELAPGFLIAMPQLEDNNFDHALILLLHHTDAGAMGIVINKSLDLDLKEIASQHGIEQAKAMGSAFLGGPVEVFRGMVMHSGPSFGDDDTEIADGLFISGSVDVLTTLLRDADRNFRLFLGYSGWGPGQLDSELTDGSWLAANLETDLIFETPAEQAWEQTLARMGVDPATVLQGDGGVV